MIITDNKKAQNFGRSGLIDVNNQRKNSYDSYEFTANHSTFP